MRLFVELGAWNSDCLLVLLPQVGSFWCGSRGPFSVDARVILPPEGALRVHKEAFPIFAIPRATYALLRVLCLRWYTACLVPYCTGLTTLRGVGIRDWWVTLGCHDVSGRGVSLVQ